MPPTKPRETQRYIIFADGHIAKLENVKMIEDSDTHMMNCEFEMKPTEMMRWAYQIGDEDYDQQYNTVKKTYPKKLCIQLDSSPLSAKWLILCSYDKKNTEFMKEIFINPYLQQIKILDSENKRMKFLLARMSNEMKIIMKHPNQAYEKYLEIMDKTRKVIRPREQSSISPSGTDLDHQYEEQQ